MFVCISLAWTKSRYWGDFPRGESRKYWFFHWESWNGICQTTVTCGICFSYNFQSLCFKLRCDWHRNLYSFQVYNLRIQYLCINITLFWNMSQIQGNRWYMMFELVHSQKSYVTVTTLDILSADFPGSFWAHYFLCNDRSRTETTRNLPTDVLKRPPTENGPKPNYFLLTYAWSPSSVPRSPEEAKYRAVFHGVPHTIISKSARSPVYFPS